MRSVIGRHGAYELRAQISAGGVGTIHATNRSEFVYKEYKDAGKAPKQQHLESLINIGRQVIVDQRVAVGRKPESSVNWPLDIVSGLGGTVAGVILPAIPVQLYHEDHGRPRDLQFLFLARSQPPPADARVALLVRMAEIFAFIHSRKLVHGDVSYRNLVWALKPNPVMYLIDCDGMLPQEPPPQDGVQSLGFADPRVAEGLIPAHDHHSDWYGLALAIYRGLLLRPGNLEKRRGTWPTLSKLPRELDTRIADLLRRALDRPLEADARPTPDEWVAALQGAYLPTGSAWDRKALNALDSVATKPPRANPPPAPPITGGWPRQSPTRPTPPAQPTQYPTQHNTWAYPQRPLTPAPPPPPYMRTAVPPHHRASQPYAPARPPNAPPPPPRLKPKDRQPGAMAQWAMTRPGWYHSTSLVIACCFAPAGLIIQPIVLIDLARTPRYYRRRTGALIASIIYLLVTTAVVVASALSLFPLTGEPIDGPATGLSPSSDTGRSP